MVFFLQHRRGSTHWRFPSGAVLGLGAAALAFAFWSVVALSAAVPSERPIVLHPKCEPLPFDFLGPFVKLGGGSVLAFDDAQLHVSRDDGKTWTPRPLFKDTAKFTANLERAALRTKSGVVIYAFSNAKETVFKWDRTSNQPLPGIRRPLYVVRSLDDGRTWEEPRLVQDSYCGATRQMIQLRNGRIVLGSQEAVSDPGRHVTFNWISDDDGATWQQSNIIDLGKSGGFGDHGGGIEATLAQLRDGRLWMLMRNPQPHFREAFSGDEGLTWTDVRHSNIEASPAPGLLVRLQSGRLALFWNRWIDREKKLGRREQLSFALSDDDGKTWTPPVIVAKDPTPPGGTGPEHRVSYPYVYEHKPGELWVTTMQGKLRTKLREADFLPAPGSAKSAAAERTARPNILFIIADDQSPLDLKIYNSRSLLQTPNIDRLAAQGMTFDGAYHMGAFVSGVCTPSRHMIKSGRTLWHLPIAPEAAQRCPPSLEQNTIAAVFNRAGYDTMRVGKVGNSYEAAKKLFTVNLEPKGRAGLEPGGSAWKAQQVLDYLDRRVAAKDCDPFLIYFGFSHPHDPRNGTDELLAKYGAVNHTDPNNLPPTNPKQPPLPVNYLPAHPFPTTLLPDQRDETQVSGVWTNRDERTIRNEIGRYFACSEEIDRQIGRVLQKLDAMGELENTYIFYTSDHGIAIGRHGLQGKQNLYQHTWRVPFIVKGPGIKPGSRAEGNIYLLDVLATLCDLAGVPAPETSEGISFKPVLEGRRGSIRDVLYGVHCGGTKPGMRCVKQGDWKLIKYDGNNGAVHQTQLFNLAENPDELLREHHDPAVIALTGVTPAPHQVNLAGDPRYAAKLAEMEALLLAEMRQLHDPWRLWNQPDDGLPLLPELPPRKPKATGRSRE